MKRILQQSGASLAIRIGNAGLQFAMFAVLARVLGQQEFGALAAMIALGTFLAIALLYGQHILLLRVMSDRTDPNAARTLRFGARLAGGLVLGGALLIYAIGALLNSAGVETGQILMGSAVFLVPMALSELMMNLARARERVFLALLPRDIVWRGLAIVLGLGALGHFVPLPADGMTWIWLLAGALAACVFLQALATLPLYAAETVETGQATGTASGGGSFWLWLNSLGGTLGVHLSVYVVSLVLGLEEAGLFFAVQRVAAVLALPLNALNIVVAPNIARLHRRQDHPGLQTYLSRNMMLLAPVVLLAFGVVLIAGDRLLALVQPEYSGGYVVLLIVATGFTVRALCGPIGVYLLMTGYERFAVALFLVTEGLALAMVPLASIHLGLTGVALVLCAGTIAIAVIPVVWARRTLGLDPSVLYLLTPPRRGPA